MKDTQQLPPEEFIPESLRQQPRHRPVQMQERASNRTAVLWLFGLPLAVFTLLAVLTLLRSPAASLLLVLIIISISLVVYFVPTIIAVRRQHKNAMAIVVLNIFLGWTFIGWVVTLVWSCTSQEK